MDKNHKRFGRNNPEDSKMESYLAGCFGPTSCKLKNARKPKVTLYSSFLTFQLKNKHQLLYSLLFDPFVLPRSRTSQPLKFGCPSECLANSKIRDRIRTNEALTDF